MKGYNLRGVDNDLDVCPNSGDNNVMNWQHLLQSLIAAVEAEIAAQRADKANLRSLRALWAERLRQLENGDALYRFETTKQVHPSLEDAPVVLDTGQQEVTGEVVFASGYVVNVLTEDLGESLGACQLLIDLTFILERLRQLLQEQLNSPFEFETRTIEAVFGMQPLSPVEGGEIANLLRCLADETAQAYERPNPEQLAAINLSANAPVLFVWGPPGTGKTTTLAWIAEACVRRGESVLLVSNTNVAVDRAMTKLLDAVGTDSEWQRRIARARVIRLGISEQAHLKPLLLTKHLEGEIPANPIQDKEERTDTPRTRDRRHLIEQAELIACTLAKAATDPFLRERRFDVLLIDEGSMASLPYVAALSGLCRRRVIIGGDFRQLPPITSVKDEDASAWLNTNIFEQSGVVGRDGDVNHRWNLVSLVEQWRMRLPICELINEPMYEGMLRTPDYLQADPQECLYLVDTAPLHACSDRTAGYSHFNVASALVCVGLAQHLLTANPLQRVGIVTPYNAQASLVHALLLDCDLAHEVHVATVHRFQGEERQVMVFDCVDAPPFGWLGHFLRGSSPAEESARLLNVAITRAQQELYLVGDMGYLLRKLPTDALLRRVLEKMQAEGSRLEASRLIGTALNANRALRWVPEGDFISLLSQDLRDALRGRGTVMVFAPLLQREDAEELMTLLLDLLRSGNEVVILASEATPSHKRVEHLRRAGAKSNKLNLPSGRQEYQDWCAFVGRQAVWWGSLVAPWNGAAFLRVASRATINELQFLRRPRPSVGST